MSTESAPQLTAAEIQRMLAAVFGFVNAWRSKLGAALLADDIPLTVIQFSVLRYCQEHPGCSQQALVKALGRDKGQIARLVRDLEAQGLLSREADPSDRRSQCLALSPAAEVLCDRVVQHEKVFAQAAFSQIGAAERATLIAHLNAITAGLPATSAEQV